MANCYITVEPCTIEEFLETANSQGFTTEDDGTNPEKLSGGFNILHPDGRGCFAVGEEEYGGEIYVGTMNNPKLDGILMVDEGSDRYREICGDEYEAEAEGVE